eukprot:15456523-Alexandrium_andersonii.AAC.1
MDLNRGVLKRAQMDRMMSDLSNGTPLAPAMAVSQEHHRWVCERTIGRWAMRSARRGRPRC